MDLFLAGLKEIAGASSQLTTWALAMLGGSVAVVIGSSHYSPANRRWRSFYFFLVPAWISLLVSVRAGNELSRSYLAALFTKGLPKMKRLIRLMPTFRPNWITCSMG